MAYVREITQSVEWEREISGGVKIAFMFRKEISDELAAALICNQTNTYIREGTMGEFPDDDESFKELSDAFTQGDDRDLWVMATMETDNGIMPFAASRIVFGQENSLIHQTNGLEDALPTHAALKTNDEILPNTEYGETPESEVVCFTRFFRDLCQMQDFGIATKEFSSIAWTIVAYLAYATASANPNIKYAVVDTHQKFIVSKLEENFAGKVLADHSQLKPTEAILETILKYHYATFYDKKSLWIVVMKIEEMKKAAETYLRKKELPIPNNLPRKSD
jgi:hypothetical protein